MEEKMAYIAGIIDGDGSLSLLRKYEVKAKSPAYYPSIQFSKSRDVLPNFLHEEFGGSLFSDKRVGKIKQYRWRIEKNDNVSVVLNQVSEYMVVKKRQALKLLEFAENCQFKRGVPLTHDDLITREKYYLFMRELNASRDRIVMLKNTVRTVSTNDNTVWAYIAGLMDTDGSFSIKREKNKTKHMGYSPVISLTLISSAALNFIKMHVAEGRVAVVKVPTTKQGFAYKWNICSRSDCVAVLERILPYLRNKKESAKILLEFCNGFEAQQGRYLLTQKQIDFRENLYAMLIEANGVYKSQLIDLELSADNAGDNKGQAAQACSLNAVSVETPKGDAVL